MRNSGLLGGLSDAARNFINNHIVMGRVAAQEAAEADDGVILVSFSESTGGGGNFERARNADNADVLVMRAGAQETVIGTAKQAFCDELIEARDNDCKTKTGSIQLSGECFCPNVIPGRSLRGSVPPW